ncbi:bifunctional DNA primase/polymerase [Dactylosporangium sp. NPDC050588]|uniref:bifunctional DNA primase/polymerase n=1 Tax=Dactylosporangium sp. NPDC050588 TaxID=3157211 RepID=UPI0033EF3F3E
MALRADLQALLRNAAERYALAGVPILPLYEVRDGRCACGWLKCERPGKHPRTPNGVHGASADPAVVARWWRWWPTANVGAATGHRFDVWDIDLPDAGPLLRQYLGDLAEVWPAARTGSGGTHVFVAPTGRGNRTKFMPGCDWRGTSGYVVLPPSVHISGNAYSWLNEPLWLLPTLVPAGPVGLLEALAPQVPRTTPARAWHANRVDPYAEAALRRECDAIAAMPPDSGRNNALNRAAFSLGQLVGAGVLSVDSVSTALLHAAARSGLSEHEAARTIRSGLAAGQRSPRSRRGAA